MKLATLARPITLVVLGVLILFNGCQSKPTARPIAAPRNVAKVKAYKLSDDDKALVCDSSDARYSTPNVLYRDNDKQKIWKVWWNRAYELQDSNGKTVKVACSVYEKLFIHENTGTGLANSDITVNSVSSNEHGLIGDELSYHKDPGLLPGTFRLSLTRVLYVKQSDGTRVAIGADHYVRIRNAGDNADTVTTNSTCTFYLPANEDDVQNRPILHTYDSGAP